MIRCIRITMFLSTAVLCFGFVALPGCTTGKDGKAEKAKDKDKGKDPHAHEHQKFGPHGGPLADWDDKYHGEVTVDNAAKTAVIYLLDDKAAKAPDIDASRITKMTLTITSEKPNITLELAHDAKKSGPEGIAYTGTHEFFIKPAAFKGNLSFRLDENKKGAKPEIYNDEFEFDPKKEGADKKKSAALRDLYLKPGGIYTAADIKANGNTTAQEKYKGKVWEHADKKPGDKVCPITNNKAETECVWTVQNQRYEFCCPPCVDKFMRWAHNEPEKIKDAKEYVFKGM